MNWLGLGLGFVAFLVIGMFHPIVVKLEYYFGRKSWWFLFVSGLIFLVASFFVQQIWSIILGIVAFGFFWSTIEIFKQHERVKKGQAKANPKRKY